MKKPVYPPPEDIRRGGAIKYHEQGAKQGKLFCRDRLTLLLDPESFVEDGLLANVRQPDLPADGVVTGVGRVDGRVVAVMANDSTVKAGSWGARTVEKILRIQESASRLRVPLIYLVDSAGARITDQIEMFPGRRGAGRIFSNQIRMSGMVPQICLLFGPSAAGGAYIPAFCDVVVMVDGNASMYLGSPRMAEQVIGEHVTLEEMGGAHMHCTISGCADVLVHSEEQALQWCRRYLPYMPQCFNDEPDRIDAREPHAHRPIEDIIPIDEHKPFDMKEVVLALVDADSWCEIKELFAGELLTGLARLGGRVVGIVANQSLVADGILSIEAADKAARFVSLCDAFNIPLVFLADAPGFKIGSAIERKGAIRHSAKMIGAVAEARVPKLIVIVRKAYGAALYAMSGPAFDPEASLALPNAMLAVMLPDDAIEAVYAKKLASAPEPERRAALDSLRAEYKKEIDIYRLASDLAVDAIVDPDELRNELISRLAATDSRVPEPRHKRRSILPT